MEQPEIVVTDDSYDSSTQDETKLNDEKFTRVSNPFYNLIKRQAKEFEEFGKRMSSDLQNSYNEYETQQKEMTKIGVNSIEMEKIYKKFEEKFDFQSKLIDSLRARIEELETDSIIKGQKIKKLENELGFEKDRSFSTRDDKKDKKSVSSVADENDKDLEIPKPDVKIPKPNVKIPKPDVKIIKPDVKILKPVIKIPVPNRGKEKKGSLVTNENGDDDRFVYHEPSNSTNMESSVNLENESFEYNGKDRRVDDGEHYSSYGNYAGPPTIYFQHNDDEDYFDEYEEKENFSNPSSSYQQYNDDYFQYEHSQNSQNESYELSQHSQQYEQFEQYDERDFNSENEQQGSYYHNSQGANNNNNPQDNSRRRPPPPPRNNRRQRKSVIHRIHTEIVDRNNVKSLLNHFSVKQLLGYEKSNLFNSLNIDDKSSIRTTIYDGLRIELTGRRKLTQPIEVYVNRRLIPQLPSGIMSYAEFKTTSQYDALSNEKKRRLQKIN